MFLSKNIQFFRDNVILMFLRNENKQSSKLRIYQVRSISFVTQNVNVPFPANDIARVWNVLVYVKHFAE